MVADSMCGARLLNGQPERQPSNRLVSRVTGPTARLCAELFDFLVEPTAVGVTVVSSIDTTADGTCEQDHGENPVVTTATKRATKASPDPLDQRHRRRIHTVSFDPTGDEWLDALLDLLTEAGYPNAGRSEIVRVGLLGLQEALAGRTRSEILKFFVLRDAERLLASFEGTPRLPFD